MRHIPLDDSLRKELTQSIKKILGQLQNVQNLAEANQITDQTFIQLLAIKGGVNKICKEIIAKGVLKEIKNYSQDEIENALDVIFKLN